MLFNRIVETKRTNDPHTRKKKKEIHGVFVPIYQFFQKHGHKETFRM
jgi:hypothetical protein